MMIGYRFIMNTEFMRYVTTIVLGNYNIIFLYNLYDYRDYDVGSRIDHMG